jgi:copper(I)-binding protein
LRHVIPLLLVAVAACGGSGSIEVTDAWARPTPPVAETAALYVSFENGTSSDDRLVGVDAGDRCGTVELHRSAMADGVMQMRPATPEELAIPSGAALVMEPGGVHVMCIGPSAPFETGDEIELVFEFEQAGTVEVTAPVEDR